MPIPTHYHWGRSFSGTRLENTCPCPKAPCGLVDSLTLDQACDRHSWNAAKTTRQFHRAEECEPTP